ncbi:MAG: hypothetical protein HXY41_08580 [Chloroflexi bacterium]|nr:hypothetical protein [Chloroflexota bacterium]
MPIPKPVPVWLLLLAALVCYSLPWAVSSNAGLSMGAYDLAEWASLHPAVRAASPPLLASFLLRAPLVGLAWIATLSSRRKGSWPFNGILAGAIAIALLPPLEFFTQYGNDPNYRQQAALALAAFIGALGGPAFRSNGWTRAIVSMTALGAAAAASGGALQAVSLLNDFRLSTPPGFGSAGFIICCLLLAWMCFPRRTATQIKQGRAF